jgi:hypothetical protein
MAKRGRWRRRSPGLVQARTQSRPSQVAEVLVVFRERHGDGTWKHDYLLSNASLATPVREYARVFKASYRIEECLKRAKGEAGLADYQVLLCDLTGRLEIKFSGVSEVVSTNPRPCSCPAS